MPATDRQPAAPTESLSGSVKSVVFHNEETGWFVATVAVDGGAPGGGETAQLVGKCPTIWQGEEIRAVGSWRQHPTHGLEFEATAVECVAPTSARGIERYLASGIVRGIGEKWAKKIVEKFGENTLDVLERASGRLAEVKGLGPARRAAIKRAWEANRGTRDAMIFLQGHGITTGASAKIYRQYGANTVATVKQNPYRLCADIDGIGFLKADEIARKVGIERDSPLRARAGLYHTLQTLAEEGHCYCEKPELLLVAGNLLGISVDILEAALAEELEGSRLADDGGRIYLRRLLRAERRVAGCVLAILDTRPSFRPIDVPAALAWVSRKLSFELSPAQRKAVEMALGSKFSVVTGGPGVGKTTIIRALLDVWRARGLRVALVAPTGRAARRMAESTGGEAATVHRLLKWNPQRGGFVHNAENPLEADVFVVDESSMLDVELAASLLSAVKPTSTVVLVGDTDQLPSVGPGNVLRDIIDSGVVPYVRLDFIFRQKSGGWIVRNAHRVNQGEGFLLPPAGEPSDFFFVPCEDPARTLSLVLELVQHRIPRRYNLSPLADVQVLTPMRKNDLGTESLNAALQNALNPSGPALRRFGRAYRVGDRVMQIRNNYDKDVFNGDIGFVRTVSPEGESLDVDFDGRCVVYAASELDELVHAYATSIHKSQGSEYPAVVIVVANQHYVLLERNLLYTAITRGKRLVCVVGSRFAVKKAIETTTTRQRHTALADRLRTQGALPPLASVPQDARAPLPSPAAPPPAAPPPSGS